MQERKFVVILHCKSRDGAVVARWAHNPKVAGSSPAPATKRTVCRRYAVLIFLFMTPIYEDNHIIIVNKEAGEIVQGDKTGDTPLSEIIKAYLKEKYDKPGNVFCGVVHRIDRPVSGIVIFAKTSKALSRLNDMLRKNEIHKTYWALVEGKPEKSEGRLEDWLVSDGRINKTFISNEGAKDAKRSVLEYKTIKQGDNYTILEVVLHTGRKHQIRAQLANMGNPIKGDLKYGARRSNKDGSISLQAKKIAFVHPVSKQEINLEIEPTAEMKKILGNQEL